MMPRKFLHLKYLDISLLETTTFDSYDFFSLVSFLDADPALETFAFRVSHTLQAIYVETIKTIFFGDLFFARRPD